MSDIEDCKLQLKIESKKCNRKRSLKSFKEKHHHLAFKKYLLFEII